MALQLLPMQLSDFSTIISQADLHALGDDLVSMPTAPVCFPLPTPISPSLALTRLTFHTTAQRSRFQSDPTATFLKVVDPATHTIIAVARWHYYEHGYQYESHIKHELCPTPEVAPQGMNVRLHDYILTTRDRARASWQTPGEPCWILMGLVTRNLQRRRGAARMLVQWGLDRAEEMRVPAYLEAGVNGKPVYEKMGFGDVGGELVVDLGKGGGEGKVAMALMGWFPRTWEEKGGKVA